MNKRIIFFSSFFKHINDSFLLWRVYFDLIIGIKLKFWSKNDNLEKILNKIGSPLFLVQGWCLND